MLRAFIAFTFDVADRSRRIEASVVNQKFDLAQTTLVISPRALKVSFSMSLLGLSTICSTQKFPVISQKVAQKVLKKTKIAFCKQS